MSIAKLAALTLAATALVASGCGKSSSTGSSSTSAASATGSTSASTPTSTPTTPTASTPTSEAVASLPNTAPVRIATGVPLSRAQFFSRAEAICARTNAKIAATTLITAKELTRELPQAVAYYTLETNELSKLVPPSSLAHDWGTIVNDFNLIKEYTRTVASYASANKMKEGGPYLRGGNRTLARLDQIAAHDGFRSCAGRV